MPEWSYPPPVTQVQTTPGTVTVKRTVAHGSTNKIHASPAAMANPESAARIMQQTQDELSRVSGIVKADPRLRRIIVRDVLLTANVTTQIVHGLGRAFVGWQWSRPRTAAPTIIEIPPPATGDQPATQMLLVQSGVTCTVDIEVW